MVISKLSQLQKYRARCSGSETKRVAGKRGEKKTTLIMLHLEARLGIAIDYNKDLLTTTAGSWLINSWVTIWHEGQILVHKRLTGRSCPCKRSWCLVWDATLHIDRNKWKFFLQVLNLENIQKIWKDLLT